MSEEAKPTPPQRGFPILKQALRDDAKTPVGGTPAVTESLILKISIMLLILAGGFAGVFFWRLFGGAK